MAIGWLAAVTAGQHPSRRQQAIELLVFLLLIVPSMVFSFGAVEAEDLSFRTVASASIVRDLALLALVLYFIFANREPLQSIGWRAPRLWREIGVGAALFLPLYLTVGFLGAILQQAGLSGMDEPPAYLTPAGAPEYALAVLFLMVVAVAEETIFRGYLLLRIGALTRNPTLALLLSALIFSIGHGYQGGAGVIAVGVLGLLYGVIYLWRGSLVAPITLHLLQNATGVLLAPLMESYWT